MTTFRFFLHFNATPGVEGVCKDRIICLHGALCSIPFKLIFNMTTFSKKNVSTFGTQPHVSMVYERTEYVLSWCSVGYILSF